jgi:ribosome-associated protein
MQVGNVTIIERLEPSAHRSGFAIDRRGWVMREQAISDEMIRLGQFLKLAGLVDSGADAKPLLADGLVEVNGEVETRRGRQLHRGDVVALGGEQVQVA